MHLLHAAAAKLLADYCLKDYQKPLPNPKKQKYNMSQFKSESSIHCILSACTCSFDLNLSNAHQAISYIRYIVTSFIKTIEQYINDTVYDIISGID